MKLAWIYIAAAACAFAQSEEKQFHVAIPVPGPGPISLGAEFIGAPAGPVVGAAYSATIVNESVQTLADGNRIVQRTTGNTARDSQGRTRQDMALPLIGNMSAVNAPHIVFIQDPVAQTSYTLNLTDKTAHKMGTPPGPGGAGAAGVAVGVATAGIATAGIAGAGGGPGAAIRILDAPPPPGALGPAAIAGPKMLFINKDQGDAKTEDLGAQTMEGVQVQGMRTTRTIPAGEIGNDKPIEIVSEVWTSPELKTVVYSKRSDPRIGEQTFRLTNIARTEPDASLFAVPQDFKVVEGPEAGKDVIFYRTKQ